MGTCNMTKRQIAIFLFILSLLTSATAVAQMPLRVNYPWYPRLNNYSYFGFGIYSFYFGHYNSEYPSHPPLLEYRPYTNPSLDNLVELKKTAYYQARLNQPPRTTQYEAKPSTPKITPAPTLPDVQITTPKEN